MAYFAHQMFLKAIKRLPSYSTTALGRKWRWIRLFILSMVDITIFCISYFLAYFLRFDNIDFGGYYPLFISTLPIVLVIFWASCAVCGLYRQIWRLATAHSALSILKATSLGAILSLGAIYLYTGKLPPRSILILTFLNSFLLLAIVRFSWRALLTLNWAGVRTERERCLIYGAGSGGDLLARHMEANPNFPYVAIGFIDDNPAKTRRVIHGLKIFGTSAVLAEVCKKHSIETVILAFPSASGKIIRDAVSRCQAANVKVVIMPDMANAIVGDVFQPRPVDIKDLLRRAPQAVEQNRIQKFFAGKSVLVTGAGGSIGSEICRQVVACKPSRIILLDVSEYSLYQIDSSLRELVGDKIAIHPVLGSMLDEQFVDSVFAEFKPNFVLHAAAYKHVPLVELNPVQGIWNNLKGTKIIAEAAIKHKVEKFLLVSTDKAVRPTNVMGATKRCCELLVQSLHEKYKGGPSFSAVRFGNVLGSSGSVIPKFIRQIQAGGPVTVTHPEVNRFFMLTDEAVGLVLQSITMSEGGETFILDMGEPVKIVDMATQLIRLAGKEPGKDIEIIFTGMRPGEKLYEELILEGAESRTQHENIFVARPNFQDFEPVLNSINQILELAKSRNSKECVPLLHKIAGGCPSS